MLPPVQRSPKPGSRQTSTTDSAEADGRVIITSSTNSHKLLEKNVGQEVFPNIDGSYALRQGQSYTLLVEPRSSSSRLASVTVSRIASNDDFERRIPLPAELPLTVTIETLGATREAGEPWHHPITPARAHWWTWTPDISQWVQLLRPANAGVYAGDSLPSLSLVEADRPSGLFSTFPSLNPFKVTAGTTYQIAIQPAELPESNTFTLKPLYASRYHHWLEEHGDAHAQPQSDVDRDGSPSVYEYSSGSDPNNHRSRPRPRVQWKEDHWVLSYYKRLPAPSDLSVSLERSSDLVHWKPLLPDVDYQEEATSISISRQRIEAHFSSGKAATNYYRLKFQLDLTENN